MTQSPETEATEVERKKIKKKVLLTLIGIVVLISLGIGGKIYMNNQRFKDEMVTIVKSNQAKDIIEAGLKNLDSKALTSEGVIKSYKIDYDSIMHNPMGGINGRIYINNNKKLYATFILDKNSEGDLDKNHGISSYSTELNIQLQERDND